jgi:hypothetical protein
MVTNAVTARMAAVVFFITLSLNSYCGSVSMASQNEGSERDQAKVAFKATLHVW